MYLIDCIVPYPNLASVVEKVWEEHPYKNLVQFQSHPKAVYEIPNYKLYGDVAIARGMSVEFLKNFSPEIPIIEIPMSAYDILLAFNEAQKFSPEHVALIALPNATYGVQEVGSSMFKRFSAYPVNIDMNYIEIVQKAREDGADCIVGGNAVYGYCKSLGIASALIKTSKDSVRHSIDEAISLLEFTKSQKERGERLQVVFDNVSEGIVSINGDKRIVTCNRNACRYLEISEENVVGKRLDELFPSLDEPDLAKITGSDYGSILKVGEREYSVSKNPIRVDGNFLGCVLILQKVNVIRDMETKIRQTSYSKGFFAKYGFDDILGNSTAIKETKELALKYSKVDSSILIVGETGTGKELFAQSIHKASRHSSGPFVAINCAALPEPLLESELFGYAPGAFTGASKNGKVGLFELAHKGTIFLDEITEMSLSLQGRLLRVLAENSIMRVGDDSIIPVDVRIISATNRDIEKAVEEGKFRRDLYFRLNVLRLDIPPLRARGNDIIILAKCFLEHYYKKHGLEMHFFSVECYPYLEAGYYSGNVRELRNICERLSVIVSGRDVEPKDLVGLLPLSPGDDNGENDEKKRIMDALASFRNKSEAARFLKMDRSTLYRKMSKYGIPD